MFKKILIITVLFIVILALILGYLYMINTSSDNIDMVKIAGLQGPTSIGMIKMIEEKPNLYKSESNYEIIANTDLLVSKLQSNEFDIACLPVNLAANIYNKGMDYELLGVNTLNNLYVIGSDETIENITDLNNTSVYVINKGATPDILFSYILNKNEINNVTLEYSMQQSELASAIIAGKVKHAVLPEPFVSQVISKNPDCKILFDLQDELNKVSQEDVTITQGCIVVNKEFAKNNKKVLNEFIAKYTESIEFVNNNLTEAGQMCEKYSLGVNSITATTAIPRSNIVFIKAENSKNDITNFLKILYDFNPKSIGNKIPDDGFYYNK